MISLKGKEEKSSEQEKPGYRHHHHQPELQAAGHFYTVPWSEVLLSLRFLDSQFSSF